MRLIKCDKCGWTDNDKDLFYIIKAFVFEDGSAFSKIDLCTKCYQTYIKWIEDKEK